MNLKKLTLLAATFFTSVTQLFAGPKPSRPPQSAAKKAINGPSHPGVKKEKLKPHIPTPARPAIPMNAEPLKQIMASIGIAEGQALAQKLLEKKQHEGELTTASLKLFFNQFVTCLPQNSRNFYETLLTNIDYSKPLSPLTRNERTRFYEAILKTKSKTTHSKDHMDELVKRFYALEDVKADLSAENNALDEFVKLTEGEVAIPKNHDSWNVWCNMVKELPPAAQK